MPTARTKPTLTEGPLFGKMILYVIPIIMTGILQLLYNTADQIVVGRFSGDPNALAAVGSTSSATALVVNVIIGMTAGAVVVMSQSFGAGQDELVSRAVHTVISFAAIAGVCFALLGLTVSRPLLTVLGTKSEYIESAVTYMRIIMCGVPASVLYNFSASVFRAKGDSRTPFIILSLSGLANVLLNLVFVIVFDMGVAGVATATIISQYISAIVILALLMRTDESYRLEIKSLRIDPQMLKRILTVGVPSGIQSAFFSLSNMLVQSAVNTLTVPEVGGNTVGTTIEGYTYTTLNSYYHATLAFVGQNYGAGKVDRVKRSLLLSVLQVLSVGIVVGGLFALLLPYIATLFVDMTQENAVEIVAAAVLRSRIILPLYFLCGWMESLTGYQRGLGSSLRPMIVSLFCVCGIRIFWAKLLFPLVGSASFLYAVYPISWALCGIVHLIFTIRITRKKLKPIAK